MSVTAPAGFTAAGVSCGIKEGGALDLALVVAVPGALGAAVFTTNRAAAPPVALSRAHLAAGPGTRAVVVNSGCANAATGEAGAAAARQMAETAARSVGCEPDAVLVASTGTIGTPLPVIRVTSGIEAAFARCAAGALADRAAATAIMTTDSVPKQSVVRDGGITVGGMAKGAGMVRPDMATMLAVLTTDAVVEPETLATALGAAVDVSFHGLDIDGCESTNDSVFLLASGASGERIGGDALTALVTEVCRHLAHQLAADAEGASRVVTITVAGAPDAVSARAAGRAIADSALVRASFFGGDPNWGRIAAALGASGVDFDLNDLRIAFDGVTVAAGGVAAEYDEAALLDRIATGDLAVEVTIGWGQGTAEILTTDLTPEYVVFNGERS